MFHVLKETSISEKVFTETNYKRLQKTLLYIKNNLIDSNSGMHLTVDYLIEINNIITSSNNIALKKLMFALKNIYFMMEMVERVRYCLQMMMMSIMMIAKTNLNYIWKIVIVLLEVQKKYRQSKYKNTKNEKWKKCFHQNVECVILED